MVGLSGIAMGSDSGGLPANGPSLDRSFLSHRLSEELGVPVEVVTSHRRHAHRVSGLAICSGRVLSFVIDAQARTLRTRNLFELRRLSRKGV